MTFLDIEVSFQNNILLKKSIGKKHRQNFLRIDSEHRKSLKDSIPYSQALRVKRICTTSADSFHYCKKLKQRFVN